MKQFTDLWTAFMLEEFGSLATFVAESEYKVRLKQLCYKNSMYEYVDVGSLHPEYMQHRLVRYRQLRKKYNAARESLLEIEADIKKL